MARRKSRASWGRHQAMVRPDGSVRKSQVVTTFGPGAMMDLIDHAVLVGGLDFWSYDSRRVMGGAMVIQDARLRDSLVKRGVELDQDRAFIEPPEGDDSQPARSSGIQVLEFPSWFVCQNPKCRALVRANALDLKGGRYIHRCDTKKATECVPVRFVLACRKGHIEEFRWIDFAHGYGKRCAAPNLSLIEGETGDFSQIVVSCACGESQALSTALVKDLSPQCGGHRPWLGSEGREECDEQLRLMVRTASNSYFPQVVSALSIPDPGQELHDKVRSVWDVLKSASAETLPAFRTIDKVRVALEKYNDASVLAVIDELKGDGARVQEPLRTAELKTFTSSPLEAHGDLPRQEELFFARRFVPDGGLPSKVARVVLAHKLREVRVQVGFTRIEPPTPDLQGEFDLNVENANIGLAASWLPATEIRGEGVFIQLDDRAVAQWERRPAVLAREEALASGYASWAGSVKKAPAFPGARFYMLHSLSHLLISAISLECGYAASAIRERIYCSAPGAEGLSMAAILLSTGTAGTEGTLGGLVEQGRHIGEHLRRAYDLGVLCSNDPICAAHSPAADHEERFLEGAACHGCLFIAECSCERFNRYLDRALVVPTMGHDPALAFFGQRP
jgi:hypothetical protein